METQYIIRKQLSWTPARFILGCIGPISKLSDGINPELLSAIEGRRELGRIEDVMPVQDFLEAPESYLTEMNNSPLATTMIILEGRGSYTDLHRLKRGAVKIERQFTNSLGGRIFNVNPGAVGTYGICLASHKSNEFREDSSTYAYGSHPHLLTLPSWLFGGQVYHERITRWEEGKMILINRIANENRFPEYVEPTRLARFEELVRTLPRNDISVELLADKSV